MKIVRDVVFKENKIPIVIIGIAVFTLFLTLCDISINFADGISVSFKLGGLLSAALSVLPLTWVVSGFMLMKLKKTFFAKLPAYIICGIVVIALIIYYIAAGESDIVRNLLMFAVGILVIYPFIITTLTIEGRMYNKVFAEVFSIMLLVISFIGAIIICFVLKSISFSLLVPALIYLELSLLPMCFDLKKKSKKLDT